MDKMRWVSSDDVPKAKRTYPFPRWMYTGLSDEYLYADPGDQRYMFKMGDFHIIYYEKDPQDGELPRYYLATSRGWSDPIPVPDEIQQLPLEERLKVIATLARLNV